MAASIITIIALCTESLKFLRDIREAPKERANMQVTICGVKGVVEEVRETIEQTRNTPNRTRLKSIPSLVKPGSPLASIQDILTTLTTRLDQAKPARGIKKVAKRARWPFEKEEIKTILTALDVHQKTILLAFQNDIFLVTQNICEDIKLLQDTANTTHKELSIVRKEVEKVGANVSMSTTISKDGFQRIEGSIVNSESKTRLGITQISRVITATSQENFRRLEELQALIRNSGINYTPQDFEALEHYRDLGQWSNNVHHEEMNEDEIEVGSEGNSEEDSDEDDEEDGEESSDEGNEEGSEEGSEEGNGEDGGRKSEEGGEVDVHREVQIISDDSDQAMEDYEQGFDSEYEQEFDSGSDGG